MEIRRLDAADPEAMAAWHATYHDAQVHEQDHPSPWMLEEMRASFLGTQRGRLLEPFGGYVDGACVTTGVLELPLMDNLDVARVDVGTRPEDRRRGHGSALLEHLTGLAVTHGRGTLQTEATWAYDAPADGAGTAGADFLTGHGFVFCLGDVKRLLALPVEEALLDRLAKESAVHHTEYRLRDFVGPVPEDIIDGFGVLIGSLMEEAPKGEMDLEAEVFDADRIRADEVVFAASGRTRYTTVAVAPSGELAAYSELAVPAYDPDRVYQWGTLVRPEHRGHRLGMATKVHNLRQLQEGAPARTTLTTYNAEVNSHMVAVNEALGFRPVGRLGEFQKRLRPAAA
jgi:GNAT superfamily N-acetyltransferase